MKKIIYLIICLEACALPSLGQQQHPSPVKALENWLARTDRTDIEKQPFARVPLSRQEAEEAARLIYNHEQQAFLRQQGHEWQERRLVLGTRVMPFAYSVFGENPVDGRSLYISLHGGGNTTAAINDSQWRNQQRLYTPCEGLYIAPRAAVDDWNMWFQPHVDTLLDRLIRLTVALMEVNPDKVYLLGYSAGGDGVYRLAPRLADRWAAAAMMAGHPGDISPLNLRNIGFSIWVGENDAAYHRNAEAIRFAARLDTLAAADPQVYPHQLHVITGKGHWMERRDTLALPWLSSFRREPLPGRIAWQQDDVPRDALYWLSVPIEEAIDHRHLIVTCENNTITILQNDYPAFTISVNDAMIDLDKPVKIIKDGKTIFKKKIPRDILHLYQSIQKRGDPRLVFPSSITIH
jgi:pimeloyl-ACP methyl ester carboxylesterase